MSVSNLWHYQVNDGDIKVIGTKTSLYHLAASAVAALEVEVFPATIRIWDEKLLPNYGPYLYQFDHQGMLVSTATDKTYNHQERNKQ